MFGAVVWGWLIQRAGWWGIGTLPSDCGIGTSLRLLGICYYDLVFRRARGDAGEVWKKGRVVMGTQAVKMLTHDQKVVDL